MKTTAGSPPLDCDVSHIASRLKWNIEGFPRVNKVRPLRLRKAFGLAFFMDSTVTACVVALYPGPGGATESELHFGPGTACASSTQCCAGLEPDIEGLVVNRLADPPAYAIAPIDQCYALTGAIKLHGRGSPEGRASRRR